MKSPSEKMHKINQELAKGILKEIRDYAGYVIPDPCKYCSNHPSNGGTGICHCTLGSPKVTCNSIDCQGR